MLRGNCDGRLYSVENKTSPNGKNYTTGTLSHSTRLKDGSYENQYLNLVVFGQTGEYLKGLPEGTAIIVEGGLEVSTWTNNDGLTKASVRMVVDHARKASETRLKEGTPTGDVADAAPATASASPFN